MRAPTNQRLLSRAHTIGLVVLLASVAHARGGLAEEPRKPRLDSIQGFAKCVDDEWEAASCLDALLAFVKRHPDQAFAAGRAVTTKMNHAAAMPFFERAFAGKRDKQSCRDDRLAMAVVAALALPDAKKVNDSVAAARNVLGTRCWDELRPAVVKALESEGVGSVTADNVCPLLAERKVGSAACAKPAASAPPAPAPRWEALDPRSLDVEGPAKVFRGEEGRQVTLVGVKGRQGLYLLKFEGFRGPWNGRVILHREKDAGSGYDYWTEVDGAAHVSLVVRKPWGGLSSYEAYPKGDRGPFPVAYDGQTSKQANGKTILSEFVAAKAR